MKINWKARFYNKAFWMFFIPAVLLVVKSLADLVGVEIDFTMLSQKLIKLVESVFGVLVLLGVAVDPTTKGIEDSDRAMTYDRPA